MDTIIILSKNSGIVPKEELTEFAVSFQKEDFKVLFSTPKQLGTQVTLYEVLEIWIDVSKVGGVLIAEKVVEIALESFWTWAKKRMQSEKKPRPKTLTIYNNEKKIIRIITINEKGERIDETEKKESYPPRPPKETEDFFDK